MGRILTIQNMSNEGNNIAASGCSTMGKEKKM